VTGESDAISVVQISSRRKARGAYSAASVTREALKILASHAASFAPQYRHRGFVDTDVKASRADMSDGAATKEEFFGGNKRGAMLSGSSQFFIE